MLPSLRWELIGGVTDLDGHLTLTLEGNSNKLRVSYVGMKTQVVNVAGKSSINITLEDESNSLNDVVVIGYGAVKKKDLTGAVATVDNKALTQVPVASASEALTGKMPGVQVSQTSIDGMPHVKDILSKKSVDFMTREQPDHQYSIGWNYTPKKGRPWIRTGSLAGTSALILKYDDGQCWILITNTSTWKGHGFSNDSMAFFEKMRKKYMDSMPKQDLFLHVK